MKQSNNKLAFEMLDIIVECINNEQSVSQLNKFSLILDKLKVMTKVE